MTPSPPLHVTNGDVVAGLIDAEPVLAWRDVLHEGPVPGSLSPAGLRVVRARFLAECSWLDYEQALADMRDRDEALRDAGELVLWFERDLYDQLQLLQVLDRLGRRPAALVDLGEPADSPDLDAEPRPVSSAQAKLGRAAWAAFRSSDPTAVEAVIAADPAGLPFLGAALIRHLEQFPAVDDGLSRTERTILEAVAAGSRTRAEVFADQAEREERPFMGDSSLWLHLDRLLGGRVPLLTELDDLALTPAGEEVLAGGADSVRLNGIDRWLGGVRLRGDETPWRWDPRARRLVRTERGSA